MEVPEVLQLLDLATRLTKRAAVLILGVQRELHSYLDDHLLTTSEIGTLTEALQKQNNLWQLSSTTFNLGDGIISRLEAEKRRRCMETLPIELRQRIMGMAVSSHPGAPGSALSFSHVNRHWRDMVVSTPSLWSDLHIPEFHLVSEEILKLYMERSMNAPLTIVFHFGGRIHYDRSLLNILVSHISRWHHVQLSMHHPNSLEAVVKATAGKSAPILHTLKFSHYEANWPHVDEEQPLHCPNLRRLTTPANLSPPSGPLVELVAPALRYAHITWFTPMHLPKLNHYQNIDTLILDFIFTDSTRNSFDMDSINLPRLKRLDMYLRLDSLKYIIPLLSHIRLPNLKHIGLSLHKKRGYVAELPASSIHFLQLPSLETCHLEGHGATPFQEAVYLFLDQFMRQLTTLSELVVEDGASFDLNRLLSSFQDEAHLPRLSKLRIGGALTLGFVKPIFDQSARLAGLEEVKLAGDSLAREDQEALRAVIPNLVVQ